MKSKLITVLIITSMMLISCNENNNSTNTKNVENSVSEFIIVDTDVSSSDEALRLVPKKVLSLEQALEFIDTDELLEITPESLRIRKKILDPTLRKRANIRKQNGN